MVYINTQDAAPVAYIPSNGWPYSLADLRLVLRNTTDGREVEPVLVARSPRGFLLRLSLELPEGFGPGEWQYSLTSGEDTIATGLLSAYDGNKEGAVQYDEDINAIQYDG